MEKSIRKLQAERAAVPWPMAVAGTSSWGRQAPCDCQGPSSLIQHQLTAPCVGSGRSTVILYCAHLTEVFTMCGRQPLKGVRGKSGAAVPCGCRTARGLCLVEPAGAYRDCHCSARLPCRRHRGVKSWLEAGQSLPVQVLLPHKLVQIPLHSQMEILIACQARHFQSTVCGCAL